MAPSSSAEVEGLFSGIGVLELTDPEIAHLVYVGLAHPYMRRKFSAANASEALVASLVARGLLERSGEPSDQLRALWSVIAPVDTLVLVDCTTTVGTYCWTYSVGLGGFAELTESDNGATWLLGDHEQLLGRVLLTAGVAWFATDAPLKGVDPLVHGTRLTTMVSRIQRDAPGTPPLSRSIDLTYTDAGDRLAIAGRTVEPASVVSELAGLLAAP